MTKSPLPMLVGAVLLSSACAHTVYLEPAAEVQVTAVDAFPYYPDEVFYDDDVYYYSANTYVEGDSWVVINGERCVRRIGRDWRGADRPVAWSPGRRDRHRKYGYEPGAPVTEPAWEAPVEWVEAYPYYPDELFYEDDVYYYPATDQVEGNTYVFIDGQRCVRHVGRTFFDRDPPVAYTPGRRDRPRKHGFGRGHRVSHEHPGAGAARPSAARAG